MGEKLENARRSPFSIADLTCFTRKTGQLVLRGFQRELSWKEFKGNPAYNSLVTLMWLSLVTSFPECKEGKVAIKFKFSPENYV